MEDFMKKLSIFILPALFAFYVGPVSAAPAKPVKTIYCDTYIWGEIRSVGTFYGPTLGQLLQQARAAAIAEFGKTGQMICKSPDFDILP